MARSPARRWRPSDIRIGSSPKLVVDHTQMGHDLRHEEIAPSAPASIRKIRIQEKVWPDPQISGATSPTAFYLRTTASKYGASTWLRAKPVPGTATIATM